jgi:NMT1/THI5 like
VCGWKIYTIALQLQLGALMPTNLSPFFNYLGGLGADWALNVVALYQAVAAVLQKDQSAIVTLQSSGISRPRELDGKRYASYGVRFALSLSPQKSASCKKKISARPSMPEH